ncbi:RNA ligase [Methanococcoides alaskense]|uniref:ATP-dependent DNA ligase n=1 Tax=Methanococcoides alaskense TaxID=325778 RepID=A0AA90ZD09_9EURY|nr:RNA ligase [Methanococcoides alaskense]MDA0524720.1 RNA ligase [Methanococcoides alaskense]MDR6223162.1 putative ATP-dependent DNA ligase [Methanococcoides alaskense]
MRPDDVDGIQLDVRAAADYLDLPVSKLQKLLQKRELLQLWGDHQHLFRFDTSISHIDSGSVLQQKNGCFELIRGFPKIQRAMLLKPAIEAHFSDVETVCVEEKMNGFNVRIVTVDGKIIAITRGGYVCPYSTERVQKFLDIDLFEEHPELVLHGEMVGPDNPYIPKKIYNVESLELFVFDIRHKHSGIPLPLHERRQLAKEYGFTQVRLFGEFSKEEAPLKIREIIRELGKIEHEGVIIKDPMMEIAPLKYTCSQSNCADLKHAFKFYNDVGRDYLFSRVVREGFQAVEWKETSDDIDKRCLQLGRSILYPMIDSINDIGNGSRVADEVQMRVSSLETVSKFKEYLRRQGMETIFSEPEVAGDEFIVKIRKLNKSTNDKTLSMWKGETW